MVLVGVEEEGEAAIVLLDELEVLVVVVVVDLEEGVVVGVVVDAFLGRRRQQGSGQGRQAKCQFLGPRWQSHEIRLSLWLGRVSRRCPGAPSVPFSHQKGCPHAKRCRFGCPGATSTFSVWKQSTWA